MQPVPKWKFIILGLAILLFLWPIGQTIKWYHLPRIDRATLSDAKTREIQTVYDDVQKRYTELVAAAKVPGVTEEVVKNLDVQKEDLRKEKADLSKSLDKERSRLERLRRWALPLGLDLQGGIHAVIRVDTSQAKDENEGDRAVASVMMKITNRLDLKNIREPVVEKQGKDYILVQIPGISDPKEFQQIIGTTGKLEFKLLYDKDKIQGQSETGGKDRIMAILTEVDSKLGYRLVEGGYVRSDAVEINVDEDDVRYVRTALFDPNTGEMKPEVREIVNQMAYGYQIYIGQAETRGRVNQGRPYRALYLLETRTRLTGEGIKRAYAMRQTAGLQQGFYVSLEFDRAGGRTFRSLTGDNVQKRLAVVLDNTVYSAPVIREEIGGGQAQISGDFTSREANNLAVILQEGALPARAIIEELRSIDPMLGMDSIKQGLRAGFIGAAAVVLFMVGYYYFCGLVADLALVLNILFLVGCMCLFKSTLTMPGIAGIVLFIGMAVDANVLIYERIREEMAAKPDRAISLSVDRGYDRAFAVIFDSNLTTLITSLVLFQFGSGPVQGFAIALSLGIIISMVTAIVITRIIMDFWTNNLGHRSIRMGGWHWLATRKIKFFRIRNVCFASSILVIIVGLAVLVARRGDILGIDFTGGTLMRIGFDNEISAADLRKALTATEVAKSETRIQREKAIGRLKATGEVETAEQSQFAAVYQVRFKEKLTFEDLKLNEALNKIGITGVHAERAGTQEEQVGGQITGRLRTQALWALFYSTVLIIIYVSVRFEFVFAITSVIALFHDMAISCSLFALASLVLPFRIEINLPEIAALLTIFGYSINDTIVVFDRIRETVRPGRGDFTELVDRSINETLPRTTITFFTTILTALALLFFGGPVVFSFALMLVFGLTVGTYSSIFIASALVVLWKRRKQKQAAQVVTQRVPS